MMRTQAEIGTAQQVAVFGFGQVAAVQIVEPIQALLKLRLERSVSGQVERQSGVPDHGKRIENHVDVIVARPAAGGDHQPGQMGEKNQPKVVG